jgi:hypothetical protein
MNATVARVKRSATLLPGPSGLLQRKCACEGSGHECEECRKKETLRRKVLGPDHLETVPPIVHEVLQSSGVPLDLATREFMEPRFGHDFGRVRVHADAKAARSAQAVNAHAFTAGWHVAFGAGLFAPSTDAGRKLLAHELQHVVQQAPVASALDAGAPLRLDPPASHAEAEAEAAASRFPNGLGAPLAGVAGHFGATPISSAIQIARQPAAPTYPAAPAAGATPPAPAPPWESRIDVRASAIAQVGSLPIYHAFIVYYDKAKKLEFFTRGGNTKGKPVCPGVGRPKGPGILGALVHGGCPFDDPSFGAIGVGPINDIYGPTSIDWPAVGSRTVLRGPASDAKPSCFAKEADRISKACIPYSPCGPNSNSVASTLLKNCDIPAEPPGGFFPGWDTLL